MRRSDGLYDLSRRSFCVAAGAGALGLAVGCTDGSTSVIATGGLGGGDDGSQTLPDAHLAGSGDAGTTGATCTGTPIDVGAPSTFVAGTPKYFSTPRMFVVRDSNGLYALTARCTHEGVVCTVSSGHFYCPRHGAEFTFNGAVITGPTITPLAHYALCLLPNGNVGLITTMTVSAATRMMA